MTSNESAKWEQINKWYNREVQLYEQAIADGTIQQPKNKNTKDSRTNLPPKIVDGDVTCTGMKPEENTADQNEEDEQTNIDENNEIQHPGPRPINIYNRGVYENWKEVIFPLSLQKIKEAKRQRREDIKRQQQQQHQQQEIETITKRKDT